MGLGCTQIDISKPYSSKSRDDVIGWALLGFSLNFGLSYPSAQSIIDGLQDNTTTICAVGSLTLALTLSHDADNEENPYKIEFQVVEDDSLYEVGDVLVAS
ncbi:hypothetical protein GGF38_000189 [Coemansia sp. RSA 25]|nr:hypothetical protein GGF38_000189 [Coemansia sp. RSA 25]